MGSYVYCHTKNIMLFKLGYTKYWDFPIAFFLHRERIIAINQQRGVVVTNGFRIVVVTIYYVRNVKNWLTICIVNSFTSPQP